MQCLLKFLEWKERGNKWLKFGEEKNTLVNSVCPTILSNQKFILCGTCGEKNSTFIGILTMNGLKASERPGTFQSHSLIAYDV